jgi:hypothetical protein
MRKLLTLISLALLCPLASCAAGEAPRAPAKASCTVDQAKENPLHDHRRISDVQVLIKKGQRGNVLADKQQGLALAVTPERGLTREWLSHVLACDVGAPHAEGTSCPLSLPGAEPSVDSIDGQLVVYVRYADPGVAERAAELASERAR